MKKVDRALAFMLALGLSAACAGPQPERGDDARPSDRNESAADEFVSEARQALNELGDEFEELETRNADLQGESAEAWAEAREEIVQVRQSLATDLDRLSGASTEDAEDVRSRVAESLATMTHHVERAELLATNGDAEFVTAARERLAEVERDIASLQSNAARLPMDAREEASQSVEDLRSQANDVSETVMSIADAAPQEIAEQREEVADDVAALSASVRRESFELQAALEN
jgi:hypothetical protein